MALDKNNLLFFILQQMVMMNNMCKTRQTTRAISFEEGSIKPKLQHSLMAYLYLRAAHSTTGLSLAHIFTGQQIRLHLDLHYPSLSEKMNKRYMNVIISEYKALLCFCYHTCIYLANLDNHFCFLIFPHIIRQLFSSLHLFA